MIVGGIIVIILSLIFCGTHFEKWLKFIVSPNFFSVNMKNINRGSPLNKMIPLLEVLGCRGGVWACARWTLSAHGLILYR